MSANDPCGMRRFRKKPVEVEAIRFVLDLIGPLPVADGYRLMFLMRWPVFQDYRGFHLRIATPEGEMRANLGDWIVRGVAGEYYPVRPDIFEQTYIEAKE